MKCEDCERLIYLYNELDENQTVELRRHLESCDQCRQLFQTIRVVSKELRSLPLPHLENSAAFTHQVMNAIASRKAQPKGIFSFTRLAWIRYSFAALSFLLCLFFYQESMRTPGDLPQHDSKESSSIKLETHDFLQNARRNRTSSLLSSCLRECGLQSFTTRCEQCHSKIKEIVSI